MLLIFLCALGVLAASPVLAEETTTNGGLTVSAESQLFSSDNYTSEIDPMNNVTTPVDINIFSSPNISLSNSTSTPTGDKYSTDVTKTAMPTATTPKPIHVVTTPKLGITNRKSTTTQPLTSNDDTGIIIITIIILVAVVFAVACFVARKRGRRYSVDFTSRPDETNIPLSGVEPGLPVAETTPLNGTQVFESEVTSAKEPKEAEVNPEAQEEQKAEPDKSDPDPESAAAVPDKAEPDTTSEDVVEQPSRPTPVGASEEEKTDLEAAASDKPSEETPKEANENNNNNAVSNHRQDSDPSNIFWEVPLGRPVKDIITSV